jgi:hypothetical protein
MTEKIVCITTGGRCGSNFLCEVHEQNDFNRFSEPYIHNFFAFNKINHLTFQNGNYVYNKSIVRKIVFHNHNATWLPHVEFLKNRTKLILNFRKDKLKQELSHRVWKYIDTVLDNNIKLKLKFTSNPDPNFTDLIDIEKLYVDPSELISSIKTNIAFDNTALNFAQKNDVDYSIIYYEDLFSDQQPEIFKELGMTLKEKTYYQKSRFRAIDIIENYEELIQLNWREHI